MRQMINFSLPKETLSESGVTDSNLVQFLGLIEQKCNELLTLNYIINSPKKITQLLEGSDGLMPSGGVAGLLGQGPTPILATLTIIAPSTGFKFVNNSDDHDSGDDASDDDDRPLTREEVKQRTLRGVNINI
jgi:hypothetical protein